MKDIAALCGCEVLEEINMTSPNLIRSGLGRVWRSLFKTRKRSSPPLTEPKKVSKSVVVSCKPKREVCSVITTETISRKDPNRKVGFVWFRWGSY